MARGEPGAGGKRRGGEKKGKGGFEREGESVKNEQIWCL